MGVYFFPIHGLLLLLVRLFPMRRLFLVLPAILLSPKRCSCVYCATHNARAAWDGSPTACAVGRLILLSPKRCLCPRRGRRTKSRFAQQVLIPRQLCSLCSHNAQAAWDGSPTACAVGRLILLSPKRCLCVNYARFARIMRRPLGTGRQPLARLDVYSFPIR